MGSVGSELPGVPLAPELVDWDWQGVGMGWDEDRADMEEVGRSLDSEGIVTVYMDPAIFVELGLV